MDCSIFRRDRSSPTGEYPGRDGEHPLIRPNSANFGRRRGTREKGGAGADVDESGFGDVGGDLAGILLERRGELHGGGRGEIAHLAVFGAFNQGCCGGDLRVRRKGATGGGQGGGQFGFEVGEHKSPEL